MANGSIVTPLVSVSSENDPRRKLESQTSYPPQTPTPQMRQENAEISEGQSPFFEDDDDDLLMNAVSIFVLL